MTRVAIVLFLVLSVLTVVERMRAGRPTPAERPPRPDLRKWDLTGCYELRVGPWEVDPSAAASAAPIESVEAGEPGPAGDEEPGPRAGATPASGLAEPRLVSPPVHVLLTPDSVDEWGRLQRTHRVASLSVGDGEDDRGSVRWLARADTLWLLWAAGASRGGVALFASGDSMVGRARVSDRRAGVEATASAAAWKMNCATRERDRPRAPRR